MTVCSSNSWYWQERTSCVVSRYDGLQSERGVRRYIAVIIFIIRMVLIVIDMGLAQRVQTARQERTALRSWNAAKSVLLLQWWDRWRWRWLMLQLFGNGTQRIFTFTGRHHFSCCCRRYGPRPFIFFPVLIQYEIRLFSHWIALKYLLWTT